MLLQIIKNLLLDQALRERINWLLSFYGYLLVYFLIFIILYGGKLYVSMRRLKDPELEGMLIPVSDNTSARKSFWMLIKNVRRTLFSYNGVVKYKLILFRKMIKEIKIGLIVVLFSWVIVSTVFWIAIAITENKKPNIDNLISQEMQEILINKGLITSITSQDVLIINQYLTFFTLYILIFVLIGGFFYTFSFGNRFVENIGVLMRVLAVLLFFFGQLLNLYQKYAL